MSVTQSLISEVESALSNASGEKRIDVLRRVTDLFVGEAEQLTAEKSALFDGVMGQLIRHIESRAAIELSRRLAPIANAPPNTIRTLARHDDIEISGPVLAISERLTDDDLIEIAETKSNAHLVSISRRAFLKEPVTDVLVDRGDGQVAHGLAINVGARFSQIGFAKMVMRADGDERLTEVIGRRSDIPPRLFRQLLVQATEVVRNKLLAAAPLNQQETIKKILAEISAQVAPGRSLTKRDLEAQRILRRISQDTRLVRTKVLEFAAGKRRAEVVAGLSILVAVPFVQIDRLFGTSNGFGLMVLCKTLALDWRDAEAIIAIGDIAEEMLAELRLQYEALSVASAQRLFRFWVGRQKVNPLHEISQPPAPSVKDASVDAPVDLRGMVNNASDVDTLLEKLLDSLQIDAGAAADNNPSLVPGLQRLCAVCSHHGRCRRELDNGTAAENFRDYCPNAEAVEQLMDPPQRNIRSRFSA